MIAFALLGFVGGTLAGWAYFAGSWWTLQRTQHLPRPGIPRLLSFLLRVTALAVVALLALRLGPVTLVAGLVGFLAIRATMFRRKEPRERRLPR